MSSKRPIHIQRSSVEAEFLLKKGESNYSMNSGKVFSREIPLEKAYSALLLIDVQNYLTKREGGAFAGLTKREINAKYGYYFEQLDTTVIPNLQRLQHTFRNKSMEVLYTTIESLTQDGRDRSLDYKISGFKISKGSWDGKVIDEIAPAHNEIWIPKISSNVFISTHIDYVLRNLGIRQITIAGVLTDQCVESAVRTACDLGYLVTLVTDACTTETQERHDHSLLATKGYCRQKTTDELLKESFIS